MKRLRDFDLKNDRFKEEVLKRLPGAIPDEDITFDDEGFVSSPKKSTGRPYKVRPHHRLSPEMEGVMVASKRVVFIDTF